MTNPKQEPKRITPDELPPAHPYFDPFLIPRTPDCQTLIDLVIEDTLTLEHRHGLRKRKRTADGMARFRGAATGIICDLIRAYLLDGEGQRRITRQKDVLGTKHYPYKGHYMTEAFVADMDLLSNAEIGWIDLTAGWPALLVHDNGREEGVYVVTRIAPSAKLISWIKDLGLTLDDLKRDVTRENPVILKEPNRACRSGRWVRYREDETTKAIKAKMIDLNQWIDQADIRLCGASAVGIDTTSRSLYRYFNNNSFDQGGRMYRGYWVNLAKDARRQGIRINGLPVAELDYGQINLRLMYAEVGQEPPEGDLYAIEGLAQYADQDVREGVKTITLAMGHADKPFTKYPKGTAGLFPKGLKVTEVAEAIQRQHPAIADLFFTKQGMELMRKESDIMVEVLSALKTKGIVALPIHDGLLVEQQHSETARQMMRSVFLEATGAEAVVRQDWPRCS